MNILTQYKGDHSLYWEFYYSVNIVPFREVINALVTFTIVTVIQTVNIAMTSLPAKSQQSELLYGIRLRPNCQQATYAVPT